MLRVFRNFLWDKKEETTAEKKTFSGFKYEN